MSLPREEFTKDVSTVGIVHTDLHSISMQHYLRQEKPEGNHVKIVKEIQLYGELGNNTEERLAKINEDEKHQASLIIIEGINSQHEGYRKKREKLCT